MVNHIWLIICRRVQVSDNGYKLLDGSRVQVSDAAYKSRVQVLGTSYPPYVRIWSTVYGSSYNTQGVDFLNLSQLHMVHHA